ncbi:hypothetical protein GCM10010423_69730 [Streptomyces levis]|uniref:Uncharacterized protein n=1 Tax=Streptomyces levis TaxID=285566 RepID=A0ABN3P325_9ACTN
MHNHLFEGAAVHHCANARCGRASPADADTPDAFGDLDGHRPALLGVHDTFDDGTAYRAELSARVGELILFDDPVLQHDLRLLDFWGPTSPRLWKVAAADTDRVVVRPQYMDRAIPELVGIPALAAHCWTTAHADVHRATVCASLWILDWEGWGLAPKGSTPPRSMPTRCSSRTPPPRPRRFPVLGSPVCAQTLQTVARGDNLALEDQLRTWAEGLRRR